MDDIDGPPTLEEDDVGQEEPRRRSHHDDRRRYDEQEGDEEGGGEPTLYDLLYCAPNATEQELRTAYKQQALHWHPDKNPDPGAEDRFKAVNQAWSVLSDEEQRAAYDRSLASGDREGMSNFHDGRPHDDAAAAARAMREYYEAFMRAEEEEKKRQKRRERGLLVGVCSLGVWSVLLLLLLGLIAGDSVHFFPPALEMSNNELAKLPLQLDFKAFNERLVARHGTHMSTSLRLGKLPASLRELLLRTHTPYLRVRLNRTSEVRRAPEVGRPGGRGWLLVSANKGEDIYGRPLDLASNTLLVVPRRGDQAMPQPWPAHSVCARLLKSGPVKQKEWWTDLSRATGGRLRTFALMLAPDSECDPEYSMLTIVVTTLLALLASRLSVAVLAA
jgi:curved DNA-binding protein CbpA